MKLLIFQKRDIRCYLHFPIIKHIKHTLRDMAETLKNNFDVTNMPIFDMISEFGRYKTEQKFLEIIKDFDIFLFFW